MIQEYIDKWFTHKSKLGEWFRNTKQEEYGSYRAILEATIERVINQDEESDWEKLDTKHITEIDDGDYQGTLLFLIPKDTYQPSVEDYVLTHVYYGSCSGCDTLQSIQDWQGGLPSEAQISEYMTLALHLIENMKRLV